MEKNKIEVSFSLNTIDSKKTLSYESPTGEIEKELVRIWSSILNIGKIDRNDNFFELGGNSLQAARIMNNIYEAFGMELPVRTMFELQTVKALAQKIEDTYNEVFDGEIDEGII